MKEDIKKMVHQWAADNEVALPSWKSNSLIDRIEDLFNDLHKGSGHHVESLPLTWDKSLEETFDESKENPDDELQDSIQRVKVPHGWIYMLKVRWSLCLSSLKCSQKFMMRPRGAARRCHFRV